MTTAKITAAEMETKRQAVNRQISLQRHVIGRFPPPAIRERLRDRLRADGATDEEIDEALRQREVCIMRVYLAMDYHRHMRIVDGRLEITGPDATEHQEIIELWNNAVDGEMSLAAITWQKFNEHMGAHQQ